MEFPKEETPGPEIQGINPESVRPVVKYGPPPPIQAPPENIGGSIPMIPMNPYYPNYGNAYPMGGYIPSIYPTPPPPLYQMNPPPIPQAPPQPYPPSIKFTLQEADSADIPPGFNECQQSHPKLVVNRMSRFGGTPSFEEYLTSKYGFCNKSLGVVLYRATTKQEVNAFLLNTSNNYMDRSKLFYVTNGTMGQGVYFNMDPKVATAYCAANKEQILIRVLCYIIKYEVMGSNYCLHSGEDCYPTHLIYLEGGNSLYQELVNIELGGYLQPASSDDEFAPQMNMPPPKHPQAPKSTLIPTGAPPEWLVKLEGNKFQRYSDGESAQIEAIYKKWEAAPKATKPQVNKGTIKGEESKWGYNILFQSSNPEQWVQTGKANKMRQIRRLLKCQMVDVGLVPPLDYSWAFIDQDVNKKYFYIHQLEIENIFQRWILGGPQIGNLSRDRGGKVSFDYIVEFPTLDQNTWKQVNSQTQKVRPLVRTPPWGDLKPPILQPPKFSPFQAPKPQYSKNSFPEEISEEEKVENKLITEKPVQQNIVEINSEDFKKIKTEFEKAQTHGDNLEIGTLWDVQKVSGDLAFMDVIKEMTQGETNLKALYHGTSKTCIDSILYKTGKTGFLKTTGGMLGSGVYFGPDPGKAKYYSNDNQDYMIRALVNLKDSQYANNKIYDEYCVPNEAQAMPTHIIQFKIKCVFCNQFIQLGEKNRKMLWCVHIVHAACWKNANPKKCPSPNCVKYIKK